MARGRGSSRRKSTSTLRREIPAGGPWAAFRRGLAAALRALEENEYLILAAREKNYFVQFDQQGTAGMRAEAVSNAYLAGEARLSEEACERLQAMGWLPPTYTPSPGASHPSEGSPNFYLEVGPPVPCARLATLAVQTLRRIYGIGRPEELTYTCASREHGAVRLPMLPIAREIPAPASVSDAAARSAPDSPAPARAPEAVLDMRSDGAPLPTEAVEAQLQVQVARCEAAYEEAVWQLARFHSMVGRYPRATAGITRLVERTGDPAKRAAGYLALGQLLEQQHRYADAEAIYAQGLAVQPAAGETGYFLHNNRGYCLNHLGRHAEAEAHCRQAIALNPVHFNAHKNLGLALAGQCRLPEAARELLEADRRWPADPRARLHLGDLLREHPELLAADPRLAAACRERRIAPGPVGSA